MHYCFFNSLNRVYNLSIYLFVCLEPHSRIFHSFGDVTIAGEVLQILTYARHLWPLSSEGSLACHTYYDTGHPFIMVISEDPWHSHLGSGAVKTCYYDFGLTRLGFKHPIFRLWDKRSNRLRHAAATYQGYTLNVSLFLEMRYVYNYKKQLKNQRLKCIIEIKEIVDWLN